jgi:hypothetical protein
VVEALVLLKDQIFRKLSDVPEKVTVKELTKWRGRECSNSGYKPPVLFCWALKSEAFFFARYLMFRHLVDNFL